MMKFQNKANKAKQYAIGGVVAVCILALWISLPLMSGSSWDSSVSTGNPFKSQVADIGLLGTDISSEGGAPGSPLSGEMIYNPATAGENIASSLFQSGVMGDEMEDGSVASSADVSASAPAPSAAPGAPAPSGAPAGKLKAASSLSGSNSNSMTTGGTHNKFFGSGNTKSDFAPVKPADLNKPTVVDKKKSLAALLSNTAKKSEIAAKTPNMDDAKSGASSAFVKTAKGGSMDLNDSAENDSVASGMEMGEVAQLKKNDPSLSKTKITPPSKPEDATDESEEMKKEITMMIIKMVIQMALGAVFQV